jgi:hypothetical protein
MKIYFSSAGKNIPKKVMLGHPEFSLESLLYDHLFSTDSIYIWSGDVDPYQLYGANFEVFDPVLDGVLDLDDGHPTNNLEDLLDAYVPIKKHSQQKSPKLNKLDLILED